MKLPHLALLLSLAAGLVACTDNAKEIEITQTRVATVPPRQFIPNATSEQRFGRKKRAGKGPASAAASFAFTTPPGWEKLPAATMRLVNMKVPGGGECYVTLTGGGMLPNTNRWYGQAGLPTLDEAAFADLPKIKVLGKDAVYVELAGTVQGKPESMLVGALVEYARGGRSGVLSVKMIGPAVALKSQLDAFKVFCASLKPAAPAGDGHNHGPGEGHGDTPANPHGGDGSGGAVGPPSSPKLALNWKAPSGWVKGGKRAMREVTFTIGGVECYVSVLGGSAGGAEANARRWYEQLGKTGPVNLSALPTLDVLGTKAPLVEAQGNYSGMQGEQREGQGLLGVISQLDGVTVFVKMIGPASEVAAQRENFVAFCASLEKQGS